MKSDKQLRLIELYQKIADEGYITSDGNQILSAFNDMENKFFRGALKELFSAYGVRTLLDYGCGGSNYRLPGYGPGGEAAIDYLGVDEVFLYEPARSLDQRRCVDSVICFDVLEHVFISAIPEVVNDLFLHCNKILIVNVACYPARALLPNGENAHVSIRPPAWWKGIFDSICPSYPDVVVKLFCSTSWRKYVEYPVSSCSKWEKSNAFAIPFETATSHD